LPVGHCLPRPQLAGGTVVLGRRQRAGHNDDFVGDRVTGIVGMS
jgi:hypothetical protein